MQLYVRTNVDQQFVQEVFYSTSEFDRRQDGGGREGGIH